MRFIIPFLKYLLLIFVMLSIISGCAHTKSRKQALDIQEIIAQANADFYLDQRLWYQTISAEVQGETIILKGHAFFKRPVSGIIRKLKKAGYKYEIIDQVIYLPEPFEDDLAYGIITKSYVMGRKQPVDVKQEGTEMLYGEPVRLIRDADPYIQVQSSVGYLGYIPKTALRPVTLKEWSQYQVGKQAVFTRKFNLDSGLDIQMGSRLPSLGDDHVLLADGSQLNISPAYYSVVDPASNPLRAAIVASAEQYMGLPYVWGGRSADGVDCSGFVMQSYALNNLYLPRDTDEMANLGRIIGLPGWTEAMLPGDLLFFEGSRRLVTHTAIYLGNNKVIHSLGSGVQIQSMDPDHPDYAKNLTQRFIFAKRLFE